MTKLKEIIYQHLSQILDAKITEAMQSIASAKESRDNNTKSSAGDKHETARAMMQIELDNYQLQLSKQLALKEDLSKINLEHTYTKVELGSLVITSQGSYFISIGLGKVEVEGKTYYAISLASPLGKALYLKQKGDSIAFNGNTVNISAIF